jgi:hypothetical protein
VAEGSIELVTQDTSRCPTDTHYIPPVGVGGASIENGFRFSAKTVERMKEKKVKEQLFLL